MKTRHLFFCRSSYREGEMQKVLLSGATVAGLFGATVHLFISQLLPADVRFIGCLNSHTLEGLR